MTLGGLVLLAIGKALSPRAVVLARTVCRVVRGFDFR
jgi:hypothetical protein